MILAVGRKWPSRGFINGVKAVLMWPVNSLIPIVLLAVSRLVFWCFALQFIFLLDNLSICSVIYCILSSILLSVSNSNQQAAHEGKRRGFSPAVPSVKLGEKRYIPRRHVYVEHIDPDFGYHGLDLRSFISNAQQSQQPERSCGRL
jgi:hypothetical protein